MPEGNGHQDNLSRLDRIERVLEHFINEHEMFREEHKQLLAAQIVLQDQIRMVNSTLGQRVDHIGEKLDALIAIVDRDHREFHERINRLENRQ